MQRASPAAADVGRTAGRRQETDHTQPDGTFDRIGFIPNYGNSWLYIYSWQNDGEFMSPDGRTCTMNASPTSRRWSIWSKSMMRWAAWTRWMRFSPAFSPTN